MDTIIIVGGFILSIPLSLGTWFWGSSRKAKREVENQETQARRARKDALRKAKHDSFARDGHQLWEIEQVAVDDIGYYSTSVTYKYRWVCNCGQMDKIPDSKEKDAVAWYENHQKVRNRVKEGKRNVPFV